MEIIPKRICLYALAAFALLGSLQEVRSQSLMWSSRSKQGFSARESFSTAQVEGKIYVIAGGSTSGFQNDVLVYDPSTDVWLTQQTLGYFPRHYAHASVAVNGKIYVFGGVPDPVTFDDSVYIFDPLANSWTTVDPGEGRMITERAFLTVCAINDLIYVLGGGPSAWDYSNQMDIFDTKTNRWLASPTPEDSLHPIQTPVACEIGGKIYLTGLQFDSLATAYCEMQVYDPKLNTWSTQQGSRMHVARKHFSAVTVGGKIYAIGGGNENVGGGGFPQGVPTEVYDPSIGRWDTVHAEGKFTPRLSLSSIAVGSIIYALGGWDNGYIDLNEVLSPTAHKVDYASNKLDYFNRIYPNPAANTLNIVSVESPTGYKIIDLLGREVRTGKTVDHGTLTVDVSSLPRGVYYVLTESSGLQGTYVRAGKVILRDP
ncbi:MAG: kelch repeat-containing protein [Ignavibacteriota bacterium]